MELDGLEMVIKYRMYWNEKVLITGNSLLSFGNKIERYL